MLKIRSEMLKIIQNDQFQENFLENFPNPKDFRYPGILEKFLKISREVENPGKKEALVGLNIFGQLTTLKSHYYEERELLSASPLSSNSLNLIVSSEAKGKVFPR